MAFVADNKEKILSIIDGWSGKLTYDLLLEKLKAELHLSKSPSRHTLLNHAEIKHAFDLKKVELRNKKSQVITEVKYRFESGDKLSLLLENIDNDQATIIELIKQAVKLENENEKLASENKRLQDQNNILLERFVRWQYNLQKMDGVDLNKLESVIDEGLPAKQPK
jgi:hypothetical protein